MMPSVLGPTHPTAIPGAGLGPIQHDTPAARSRSSTAMPSLQEPTPPHNVKQEEESSDRGRRRSRSDEDDDGAVVELKDEQAGDGDQNPGNSSASDAGPARKRRRSRKGLDKKFECPHEGCGKSYSRAEHLYRHQLNHAPKQIYHCGMGDCTRSFVRLDLCNRHKDRHTAKGSALNRKDSILGHGSSPIIQPTAAPYAPAGSLSPEANRPSTGYNKPLPNHLQYSPKGGPFTVLNNASPPVYASTGHPNGVFFMQHDQAYGAMHQGQRAAPHQSPATHPQRPSVQTDVGQYGVLSPVSTHQGYHTHQSNTPQSAVYVGTQNCPHLSLGPSDFSQGAASSPAVSRDMGGAQFYPSQQPGDYAEQAARQQQQQEQQQQRGSDMIMLGEMAMPSAMPVFGSDHFYQKSPYAGMPEDFMAYLFNTNGSQAGDSPQGHILPQGSKNNYGEFNNRYNVPYYGATDPTQLGYFPPQQVMAVGNLLDQNLPETTISEEKSNEIFEYIRDRFHGASDASPVDRLKESIVEGDRSRDAHMLSRKMMQRYITSYWLHFSDQVPILHQPTFQPDRTPNLLLIAMMAIGAVSQDEAQGAQVAKAGARLSNFLAWDLRWALYMDPNFGPPAKLWTFQAMILLELYEKMYSTRSLHERAHIHHSTTIVLMRRGRSLIGKSSLDSPNPQSSRHSSAGGVHTADEWWNHWITNEATRRAAFAAFWLDSIHATMFGHSTVMVAHEMRLPLPCDENLWKANSGAEVGRIEANLQSRGIKTLAFLDGLKKTLSGVEIRTNAFGRTILMAGLLSVSWHMNQRDLQVNSLGGGVSQALGGRDKWRGTLTRAFDFWRTDFDKAHSDPYIYASDDHKPTVEAVTLENRTVLHHLAHMAMQVDIVDCQIFARAKRLLGRAIGAQDLNSAQRRMKDNWAPKARARDAVYYALKFLSSVLLSTEPGTPASQGQPPREEPYSARGDVLMNRPWVLYFAALVVWCYGYALEGPCKDYSPPSTKQAQVREMREYLRTFGGILDPEELKAMTGLNRNTALLMVLKESFEVTRWELLHEGATLLQNCIQLNAGAMV
ncbi:hypothetical protein RB597_006760 [Gaeumannomyces tritici]